jgi:hypothetical protein
MPNETSFNECEADSHQEEPRWRRIAKDYAEYRASMLERRHVARMEGTLPASGDDMDTSMSR